MFCSFVLCDGPCVLAFAETLTSLPCAVCFAFLLPAEEPVSWGRRCVCLLLAHLRWISLLHRVLTA